MQPDRSIKERMASINKLQEPKWRGASTSSLHAQAMNHTQSLRLKSFLKRKIIRLAMCIDDLLGPEEVDAPRERIQSHRRPSIRVRAHKHNYYSPSRSLHGVYAGDSTTTRLMVMRAGGLAVSLEKVSGWLFNDVNSGIDPVRSVSALASAVKMGRLVRFWSAQLKSALNGRHLYECTRTRYCFDTL
jgi:hypothetical protein